MFTLLVHKLKKHKDSTMESVLPVIYLNTIMLDAMSLYVIGLGIFN